MAQQLRHLRGHAIVTITAAAGVLTSPDPLSMVIMTMLFIVLYEVAILAIDDPK